MERMKVPLEEQETTFTWFPRQVDEFASVYSANPNDIRRLKKFCEEDPEHYVFEKEDQVGAFFRVHRKGFMFRKVPKPRQYTEEQLREMRDRMTGVVRARNE